ncbi:MAG: bifunctional demethylmenaquinone methyltransferase/2-methoxy-6-polyprenyl-1,4-benzoquinol methylase UbiE [Thermoguttaceae bacterium]|nr:bifunctional demethylmenaquinone methyltransferase/2-methoxy-6-polyprenyl-1,4-benzoquinol methylase UbiE [Thermoguttaceae bacterium]
MVDHSGTRVKKMFGQIAPRYDFLNHFLSGGVDRFWRWYVVRKVRPNRDLDGKILDICTGTGDLAIAFWKRYKIPVVGGDFTPEMLEFGRKKHEKMGISPEQIELVEADATAIPYPDDTFRIVSVAFGLRNVENWEKGLSEMTRVCVPGGQVAVLEFSLPTFPPFRWLYLFYFRHILPKIGQWTARNQFDAYNYLPESVAAFPQGKELAGMMESAGLSDVRFWPLTFGIATLYVGRKI